MKGHDMKGSVFVVKGSRGEYADKVTWLVAWHPSLELAKMHAENAQRRGEELVNEFGPDCVWQHGKVNEYDPDFEPSYTGASYTVIEVKPGVSG